MKRILVWLLLVGTLSLSSSLAAHAHTLKVDGSIGVTMHISPEDEPVANQPAQIHITIQDRTGRFAKQTDACLCTLTITGSETTPQEKTFMPDASGEALVTYTFPSAGTYRLQINGATVGTNSFQPFEVSYTYRVRVSSGSQQQTDLNDQPLKRYLPIVIILAAAALLVLALMPLPVKKRAS